MGGRVRPQVFCYMGLPGFSVVFYVLACSKVVDVEAQAVYCWIHIYVHADNTSSRRTNEQTGTDGRTDRQTGGRADRQTCACIYCWRDVVVVATRIVALW